MSKIKNLTGKRFGRLIVLREAGRSKQRSVMWLCKCDCGNEKAIVSFNLTNGATKSCGCLTKERLRKVNFKDITGQKFGRLTVIEYVGQDDKRSSLWKCLCDCGTERVVRKDGLTSGGTKSCGCLHKEITSEATLKNLNGRKFGRWTVLKEAGRDKWRGVLWFCQCDCGNQRIITSSSLISGRSISCGCYNKERISETLSGENSYMWKGGVTPLNSAIRNCSENLNWRLNVFARDGFRCQCCKDITKTYLNAHHKKPFIKIIQENNITTLEEAKVCEELWDVDNGITLCEDCHKSEHKRIKQKEFEININLN